MLKKYVIWNKKDDILTVTGNVYTAEQWIEKHPIAKLDSVTVLCSSGEINGALFETLGNLVTRYERLGCDFSNCKTEQEKLNLIEAFEAAKEAERAEREAAAAEEKANAVMNEELIAMSLASIAAHFEYQDLMTLPDVEV